MVERTVRDKDVLRKEKISDGQLRTFIERQPQLSIRKGDSTAFAHMDAMKKEEELDNYFITLKDILVEYDLIKKPGQILKYGTVLQGINHR